MKVILKENVEALGRMGDVVDVRGGYARNYLVPRKLAVVATERNVGVLEHEKRLIEERRRKERKAAEELGQRIRAVSIESPVQAGQVGQAGDDQPDAPLKIFGSVTSKDIVEALAKEGITVDKRAVLLENPIKELGSFPVPIKL